MFYENKPILSQAAFYIASRMESWFFACWLKRETVYY